MVLSFFLGLFCAVKQPRPRGNTPLHEAAKDGHEATVKELIAAGAKLDAANKKGTAENGAVWTAVWTAVLWETLQGGAPVS